MDHLCQFVHKSGLVEANAVYNVLTTSSQIYNS